MIDLIDGFLFGWWVGNFLGVRLDLCCQFSWDTDQCLAIMSVAGLRHYCQYLKTFVGKKVSESNTQYSKMMLMSILAVMILMLLNQIQMWGNFKLNDNLNPPHFATTSLQPVVHVYHLHLCMLLICLWLQEVVTYGDFLV